ncbi:hypothetical protein BpHYR1_041001, partial [Brachionus plicatilis]
MRQSCVSSLGPPLGQINSIRDGFYCLRQSCVSVSEAAISNEGIRITENRHYSSSNKIVTRTARPAQPRPCSYFIFSSESRVEWQTRIIKLEAIYYKNSESVSNHFTKILTIFSVRENDNKFIKLINFVQNYLKEEKNFKKYLAFLSNTNCDGLFKEIPPKKFPFGQNLFAEGRIDKADSDTPNEDKENYQ